MIGFCFVIRLNLDFKSYMWIAFIFFNFYLFIYLFIFFVVDFVIH